MRPRRYDPSVDDAILLGIGSAHHVAEGDRGRPVGKLYLPDPETRRGWREFYVDNDARPGRRRLGFRP